MLGPALAIVVIATNLATLALEPATNVPDLPTIYLLLLSIVAACTFLVLDLSFGLARLKVFSTRLAIKCGNYLCCRLLALN